MPHTSEPVVEPGGGATPATELGVCRRPAGLAAGLQVDGGCDVGGDLVEAQAGRRAAAAWAQPTPAPSNNAMALFIWVPLLPVMGTRAEGSRVTSLDDVAMLYMRHGDNGVGELKHRGSQIPHKLGYLEEV